MEAGGFAYPPEPWPGPPWDLTHVPADWPDVHGVLLEMPAGRSRKWVMVHGMPVRDALEWHGTCVHVLTPAPLPYIGYALSALHGHPRLVTLTTRPLRGTRPVSPTGELLVDGEPTPHGEGHAGPVARFGTVSQVIAFRDGTGDTAADVTVAAFDGMPIPRSWARGDARPFHAARSRLLGAG